MPSKKKTIDAPHVLSKNTSIKFLTPQEEHVLKYMDRDKIISMYEKIESDIQKLNL